jgi:16S rRNA (cytosine1402-N4)-methyltransferase
LTVQGFRHESVLPAEVLEYLQPCGDGLYLDGTLGGAGHARLILEAAPGSRLIGLDRDPEALAAAADRLAGFGERVTLRQANYADMKSQLAALLIDRVDGVLLDIGVSSHQLDTPQRGFSFRDDGPLDMRMGPDHERTAADVLAECDTDELKRIFRDYGEERWAGRIARAIVRQRDTEPLLTTGQLAELVSQVVPISRDTHRIHPATRVFQALRIEVNEELNVLRTGLEAALDVLKVGGRLVVISFHSLEDRIVKQAFRTAATGCVCPPRLPVCVCHQRPRVKLLNRRAVRPSEQEIEENPRSRSAILRAVERLGE